MNDIEINAGNLNINFPAADDIALGPILYDFLCEVERYYRRFYKE